jgi:hypothetical protein
MSWIMKDPEVVETVLEEGAVLLNLKTKFYYSLNKSGHTLWDLLEMCESSEDLTQKMMEIYQADSAKTNESVSRFLNELEKEQLVIPRQGKIDGAGSERITRARPQSPEKEPFFEPELIKHDEPLHEVVQNPFDPQLPLAE